ncbi:antibiotic biosynthesis monooxygenase [Micromonospora fluostatini]|uniref:Anthrone monooxygenase n=2 Tax=Micromonospora TaxID=1873 RepID=A0A0P0ILX5_9ACTN|nr:antibiotic biosynthesis monooxygenase family protein [Micromonospora rosaria]ALJ99860.1 FlsG [Micromonospora rosaria]KXK58789.1 Anthrone monooxygenase [Micromonospora rosaria]TDB93578.1 antibiotic biosynthesis monooxygenase [Micromonospora fluostatini]
MPKVSPEDRYLTVLNVFTTDAPEKQDRLLDEMRAIVDTAAFPGWISSTVHSGQEKLGTANFIQWRSVEDLMQRYEDDKFKHATIPTFSEITTSMMLLQNEVVYSQTHASLGGTVELHPERGDYTVIEFFGVEADKQDELIDALGASMKWLGNVPGYRSHTVMRGIGSRGYEGSFVVRYAQWDSREQWEEFRDFPAEQWPAPRRKVQARIDAVTTRYIVNTYHVVHTRSAERTPDPVR